MDERVLKWITILTAAMTVIICVSLYFFPGLHEHEILMAQQKKGSGEGRMVSVSAKPSQVVEEEEYENAQLSIGLPKRVQKEDIRLEKDDMLQTIYIFYPDAVQDYFGNYKIRGSSDHIEEISYYMEGNEGVIALKLDNVYELASEYRQGSLYLKFLDPHEVYDKVVVLDAGHGSHAPGAVKLGIAEKDIDLAILLETKKLFDSCPENIGVYYTRTEDTNPTLEQRVGLANKTKADLFISIHNNSDASGSFTATSGTQVMYSESDQSELSGKKLAQICLDQVSGHFGSKNRGLLKGDKIYIIRESRGPAALVEVGFMTNYEELDRLNDPKYQKKAAEGIYEAVLEAFKEGY